MSNGYMAPLMRVQIDSMQHNIVSYLETKHGEMLDMIQRGLEAAILELPQKIIRESKELSEQIMLESYEKALKEYWETGAGRSLIDAAIEKKFKKVGL